MLDTLETGSAIAVSDADDSAGDGASGFTADSHLSGRAVVVGSSQRAMHAVQRLRSVMIFFIGIPFCVSRNCKGVSYSRSLQALGMPFTKRFQARPLGRTSKAVRE